MTVNGRPGSCALRAAFTSTVRVATWLDVSFLMVSPLPNVGRCPRLRAACRWSSVYQLLLLEATNPERVRQISHPVLMEVLGSFDRLLVAMDPRFLDLVKCILHRGDFRGAP